MRKSTILGVGLAFLSLWVAMAAGRTASGLTGEIRVFGLVVLPTTSVASLLALYFDWRRKFLRRLASDRRDECRPRENEHMGGNQCHM